MIGRLNRFHRHSRIAGRLVLLTALSLTVFALITIPVILAMERQTSLQYSRDQARLLSKLIGARCLPECQCRQHCLTASNLATRLDHHPQVLFARLYDHKHQKTMQYQTDDYNQEQYPPPTEFNQHLSFSQGHAIIGQPLFSGDDYLGFVKLVLDLREFNRSSNKRLILLLTAFLAGIVLATGLSLKMRNLVLAPFRELASLMTEATSQDGCAQRTNHYSHDEVEELADSCNLLLQQIEKSREEKSLLIDDLHDGAGGLMTNINLMAAAALQKELDPATRKLLTTIEELSREGVTEIRRFISCVDQQIRDWQLLTAEMRRYGHQLLDSAGIKLVFSLTLDTQAPLPNSLFMLQLWRIYSEALNNIRKHARPKKVFVQFDLTQSRLNLVINDDGIGIKEDAGAGSGLVNLQKRAAAMGGKLEIFTPPGGGTRVKLEAPLSHPLPSNRRITP
ncbi:sensor histidine kinase [Desulfurivibrio alkaliphilus]|uniref:Oxygen sensor histidine kinase NreB n=1 Tax=Desulfurivibrio alkaliphilus (strain DSM 19089 / UNIQEM U267 / AHT2) TaxID=589865 RepID=D6Z2G6_DESAT|nr:ATP-binding protein [Desulfurivibrio alkaliphilus]ADH85741.1 integral membrane sensor signal transduction histidine kinase [Desulfurivibrio alkaliphilus AHT 2]